MTTDRELLELAARAYWGDEIDDVCSVEWDEADQCIAFTHADNQDHNGNDQAFLWNPIADDGDALRLAVKLNLLSGPDFWRERSIQAAMAAFNGDRQDHYADTRRAIVRAAAAIGESLP